MMESKRWLLVLTIFCVVKMTLAGTLTVTQRDSLFLEALRILPEEKIPVQFRSKIQPSRIKCATITLMDVRRHFNLFTPEQRGLLQKLLERPQLPLSYVSPDGLFKIHYTLEGSDAVSPEDLDQNGVPDYVEEVAGAFERSHQVEVIDLGFRPPPGDNGKDGPEFDVYIQNLGSQLYGYTQAEDQINSTPREDLFSFIVIDNDYDVHFSRGLNGARVTAAHEYFHAIQFGYRIFQAEDEKFYYELSSVWMEEVVFDEINDYYQYLRTYFTRTDVPFNQFDRFGHFLGEALWNIFLQKKFNRLSAGAGFDLLRRTWEIMENNVPVMQAIDQSLMEKGSRFADEFVEFALWNYFTGSRADSVNFYDESPAYPEVFINRTVEFTADTTLIDSSRSLTYKYFRFLPLISDQFSVTGQLLEPNRWKFGALTRSPGSNPVLHTFNIPSGQNLGFVPGSAEIVIIPVNIFIPENSNGTANTEFSRFQLTLQLGVLEKTERGIFQIFPNPFIVGQHRRIFFVFVPSEKTDLSVHIFSADGRVIRAVNFSDGSGMLTRSSFVWDGRDDHGDLVASGVYLIQLKQGNFVDLKKFVVIRK